MDVKRTLLLEAGHRCAIPTCRDKTTTFAHIVPWRSSRTHEFDNLIVLCPTCHARFDKGEIDRKSMLAYKAALSWRGSQRLAIVNAFRYLNMTVEHWDAAIRAIEIADVSEADDDERHGLVVECTGAANQTRAAVQALALLASSEIAEQADWVFQEMKWWADDVVDGLWPSMHLGATPHGDDGLEALATLSNMVHGNADIAGDHLKPAVAPHAEAVHLGGTGKRF